MTFRKLLISMKAVNLAMSRDAFVFSARKKVEDNKNDNGLKSSEKYLLTVQEAAEYFGIGQKKIRRIIDKNPDSDLSVKNGRYLKIKRKRFEEFIDQTKCI